MRILSVDGGGYLGLASASFLNAVEQRTGVRCADRFDLFCGTSTGAIIALALACGMSAAEVRDLYIGMGTAVFPPPPIRERVFPVLQMPRAVVKALHDNEPLRHALKEAFGNRTLGDLRQAGRKVLVTAFNVTAGRPTIFKTDHADGLKDHDRFLVRDVALASSAAPKYLPLVELTHPMTGAVERYCDGGLVSNSPALLAYAEAVSDLKQSASGIAILSLGTPRADLSERESALKWSQRKLARGLWGWGLGERIISVAIDGAAMVADTALKRIAAATGACYVRVTLAQPNGVGLDIATEAATRTLQQLGAERARDAALQHSLSPFFATTEAQ